MGVSFRQDVHMYPLYMSLAEDFFRSHKQAEARQFFQLACDWPRELELEVCNQMWEVIKAHNERACYVTNPNTRIAVAHIAFEHERVYYGYKINSINRALRKHIGPDYRSKLRSQKEYLYRHLSFIHGRPVEDPNYGRDAFHDLCNRTSTMADKLAALQSYADGSRISTWLTRLGPVHLINMAGLELEILVTKVSSQTTKLIRLNLGDHSIRQIYDNLKDCIPMFNGNRWSIVKLEAKNIFILMDNDTKVVGLYEKNGHFIWRCFDKMRLEYTWIDADPDDVRGLQRVLNETDITKRTAALNRYEESFDFHGSLEDPFEFRIRLNEFPLLINPGQRAPLDPPGQWNRPGDPLKINGADWAVTLISEGGSSGCGSMMFDPGFGHAKLICEGVENGARFIMYTHLVMRDGADGYATMSVGHYNMARSQIKAKSQTWIRPRRLVESLLESDGRHYLFNQTGNRFLGPNFQENIAKELKIGEIQSQIKSQVHETALKACPGMAAPLRDRSGGSSFLAGLIGLPTNDSPFDTMIVQPNRSVDVDTFLRRKEKGKLPTIPFLPFSTPVKEKPRSVMLVTSDLGSCSSSAHDAVIRSRSDSGNGLNCLTVQIQELRKIGIRLPSVHSLIASPNQYISWIQANPGLVSIEEIPD